MRAVSTVLDVSLFLLLVGAAATTLVYLPAETVTENGGDPADETAELLATSTAQVNYTIEPGLDEELDDGDGNVPFDPYRRTVQDSVANLLSEAAVARATIEGEALVDHASDFERRVRAVTRARMRQDNVSTSVRARWTPYPEASVTGEVRVGERPPPDVDVHAATVAVDSGVADVSESAREAAADDGFAGVADVLANATIDRYLPPSRVRLAASGDYPSRQLVSDRVGQLHRAVGHDDSNGSSDEVVESRAALVDALAAHYEAELRADFANPAAAVNALRIDRVTVTVRTWSR